MLLGGDLGSAGCPAGVRGDGWALTDWRKLVVVEVPAWMLGVR